jgi:hypothetical protein
MALGLLLLRPEALVSRRTLGIVMTMVGSALGAWWLATQQRARRATSAAGDRGTVIFDNTPRAGDIDAVI